MSRYIDVNEFYDKMYEWVRIHGGIIKNEMRAILEAVPSIDIVRCKECKKAHLTYDGDCKYCDEWKDDDDNCITVYHDGNFYCGYGERKDQ